MIISRKGGGGGERACKHANGLPLCDPTGSDYSMVCANRSSRGLCLAVTGHWTANPLARRMAVRVTTGATAWLELGGRWGAHGLLLQSSYEDTGL